LGLCLLARASSLCPLHLREEAEGLVHGALDLRQRPRLCPHETEHSLTSPNPLRPAQLGRAGQDRGRLKGRAGAVLGAMWVRGSHPAWARCVWSHPSVPGEGALQGPGIFWKQGQFQRGGSLCGLRTSLRTREGSWGLRRWGLAPHTHSGCDFLEPRLCLPRRPEGGRLLKGLSP